MTDQTILHRGAVFPSPSLGRWPLHVVRLDEIGVDDGFLQAIRPSFDRTQWDLYDVTAPVAQLANRPDEPIAPHRRRAIRRYGLERQDTGEWAITPRTDTTFRQAVADYRAAPRTFALIEDAVTVHPGVIALLTGAAETVHAIRPEARRLDAYLHQVTVVARSRQSGHPAPEGLHQDGADFIVSAMVMERRNIRGGVSRIFEGRHAARPLLEIELQPGEGIFQMDAGSDLWHEVSPIAVDDASREGHRMTFGIDLHVV